MTDEISVIVFQPTGRKFYQAQWTDPVTGLKKTRSTKKSVRRDAERVAAVWQKELMEGQYKHPSKVTWEELRDRYSAEVMPGLALKSQQKADVVLDNLEKHIKPAKVASLTTQQISKYASILRAEGKSEVTIKNYLGQVRTVLRWAKDQKLIFEVPKFNMPVRTNKATKRAVTGEEFERMLKAIPKAVGEAHAADWEFFLRGLWWSGLRLGEALALSWDDPSTLCLDFSGRRPLLSIPPDGQKNGQATLWPIPPEFYAHLMTVPEGKRTGKVFSLHSKRYKTPHLLNYYWVGKLAGDIGKAAGVKTSGKAFASAHDLRRSFGVRWSKRVMPAVLQKLMRHSSITTTMQFYAIENASETADAIWESFANTTANTPGIQEEIKPEGESQVTEDKRDTQKEQTKPEDAHYGFVNRSKGE